MKILEISSDDLINYILHGIRISSGFNGIIIKIDDDTLFKFYYRDLADFFMYPKKEVLKCYIKSLIEMEEVLINLEIKEDKNINIMLEKGNLLDKTLSNDLIKSIVTYEGYPIGVYLTYYKDYKIIGDVYDELDYVDKNIVINKLKDLILNLLDNNMYPSDIKSENILLRLSDLDVKLIDLDDKETRIIKDNYALEDIRCDVYNQFKKMIDKLNKKDINKVKRKEF